MSRSSCESAAGHGASRRRLREIVGELVSKFLLKSNSMRARSGTRRGLALAGEMGLRLCVLFSQVRRVGGTMHGDREESIEKQSEAGNEKESTSH